MTGLLGKNLNRKQFSDHQNLQLVKTFKTIIYSFLIDPNQTTIIQVSYFTPQKTKIQVIIKKKKR